MKKAHMIYFTCFTIVFLSLIAVFDARTEPPVIQAAAVTVKDPYISITDSTNEIYKGVIFIFKARAVGLKNASIRWTSSNKDIASVGRSNGKLIAKAEGKITLTATDMVSGEKASMTVTVIRRPAATPAPIPTRVPAPTPKPIATPTPKPIERPTTIPVPDQEGNMIYNTVFITGFEDGTSGFSGRGGSEIVIATDSTAKSGSYSLQAGSRTNTWHGAARDMAGIMEAGSTYRITAWVKHKSTSVKLKIQCSFEKHYGNDMVSYLPFASVSAVKDIWTKLEGTISVPNDTVTAKIYFESPESATADLYIDDLEVFKVVVNTENIENIPSIAEAYKEYFDIGVSVNENTLYSSVTNALILHQFSTITFGNEMKPAYLLDYGTNSSDPGRYNLSPAIKTAKLEEYLQYAKDHDLKVRFHTLVWHQQTPHWFFTENYSTESFAPLVTKEVMQKRLENYIKKVMECTSKYPDVIYAWDVVNEAIEPGHNKAGSYRSDDSLWYQIIGEEFVEKAFEYARKYSYDDASLFYNDYNEYEASRTTAIYNLVSKLKEKGLIDGIGMQSHIDMSYPSLSSYETAIRKFAELDLEIQVTELDMHNNQKTDEAFRQQAVHYGGLFEILIRLKRDGIANITNVTFWGVTDAGTWLTSHRGETSYPLLFDTEGLPKPAFYQLIELVK